MEVRPIMDETEMITYFVRTLPEPFYGYMIALRANEFSDLIEIGERLDVETKEGRLKVGSQAPHKGGPNIKEVLKKNEEEMNLINQLQEGQFGRTNDQQNQNKRTFDDRPMPNFKVAYSQLFQDLQA